MGFGWYAARLRAMSPREVAWRAADSATVRVRERRAAATGAPRWDVLHGALPRVDAGDAERLARGELEFWGRRRDVDLSHVAWNEDPLDGATLPAVGWRRWGRDAKPIWELHRLQHVVPLAVGGDDAARRLAVDHLLDWIGRNPVGSPYGWTSGYEAAHRLVGWAFAVPHLVDVASDSELQAIEESYRAHAAFVAARPSRFSSANNHRLGELVGLLAAAALGVREWESPWRELEQQLTVQTYADGGSREQAGGYFLYVLEILWVAALLAGARGAPLAGVGERLSAMLRWLDAVADPDGEPPRVGDDAEDRMLRLEYYAPRRAQTIAGRVAALLKVDHDPARASVLLPESGYAVFRGGDVHAVFDVGELGFGSLAAHGHADALSVLVRGRARDSGTGSYFSGDRRDVFRITAAHNTVMVDGRSQAEPLGPHLWGRRYRVAVEGAGFGEVDYVRASHDGYEPAVHTRSVTRAGDVVVVLDRIRAPSPVTATLAWHPEGAGTPAVRAIPDAEPVEVEAPWSPRYREIRTGRRLTWTASGTEIVFASILGESGRPEIRHEHGVTTVELGEPRKLVLTERWAGPMIESEG